MPDANTDTTLTALISAGFGSAVQRSTAISTIIFVGGSKSWYALHQSFLWWVVVNLWKNMSYKPLHSFWTLFLGIWAYFTSKLGWIKSFISNPFIQMQPKGLYIFAVGLSQYDCGCILYFYSLFWVVPYMFIHYLLLFWHVAYNLIKSPIIFLLHSFWFNFIREDKLVELAMTLKVDAGTEPGVDVGPVISKQVRRWMYMFTAF